MILQNLNAQVVIVFFMKIKFIILNKLIEYHKSRFEIITPLYWLVLCIIWQQACVHIYILSKIYDRRFSTIYSWFDHLKTFIQSKQFSLLSNIGH